VTREITVRSIEKQTRNSHFRGIARKHLPDIGLAKPSLPAICGVKYQPAGFLPRRLCSATAAAINRAAGPPRRRAQRSSFQASNVYVGSLGQVPVRLGLAFVRGNLADPVGGLGSVLAGD
jgi:hypothetical protein